MKYRIELLKLSDSSQDDLWAVGFLHARLISSHKPEISFDFRKTRVAAM